MSSQIDSIAAQPAVQAALSHFQQSLHQAMQTIITVQQIASPTFAEQARAAYVAERFTALGLLDVSRDAVDNVYGRFPGWMSHLSPVVVSAHMDTVFPAETDLTVTRKNGRIYGPGIGDNSTGVAGLLLLIEAMNQFNLRPQADVWFVANVGEEGMGDLRGMRAVGERFGKSATYLVVEGGLYGQIAHQAIGVRRFRLDVAANGGHSWANFGQASAIHALASIITQIDALSVPKTPKTTYNIGTIGGGTSVNTIAQTATCLLDLRSEDTEALAQLVQQVEAIVVRVEREKRGEVKVTMTQVGNRPAGQIPRQSPLVKLAESALHAVGCPTITYIIGSTDANIPLSMGAQAVCVGLTESGNAHRLDEYIDPAKLPQGLGQLLLLLLAAAES